MADKRIDEASSVLAAGDINHRHQDNCHSHNRPESDHPQAVVIVIFEPHKQTGNHVGEQQDDGNGLEHYFKKGALAPGNGC